MPRRFKESENPQKARTDWKKEQEARQPRRAPAGGRGGLLQNMMARRMGGGPGPGGGGPGGGLDAMRNHPAVGFGRQMTGGVADGPSAAIRNMVMQRLAQKGMSQDATGTWQIAGLNRPSDPGLDIRNSAIAAMDPTGEMLRRVLGAGGVPGGMRGMPSGLPGSGIPSPGLGAGSLPPGPQNGMPLPPVFPSGGPGMPGTSTTSSRPGTINGVPVPPGGTASVPPGLPGGPPMTPGTGGTVPSPGLGGGFPASVPKLPPVAPPSGTFPPQGQGVGRTTTPTGAEIDPTKYPTTNLPSLGLPPAGTAGGLNQPPPVRGDYPWPTPGSGTSLEGTNRPGGPDYVLPSTGMAPGSVPGAQTGAQARQSPTTPGLGGGSPAGFPVIGPMGAAKPPPSLGLPPAGAAGGLNQAAPSGGVKAPGPMNPNPPPIFTTPDQPIMDPPPTGRGTLVSLTGQGTPPPASMPTAGMAGGLNQAARPTPVVGQQYPASAVPPAMLDSMRALEGGGSPSPTSSMPPPSVANDIYKMPAQPPPYQPPRPGTPPQQIAPYQPPPMPGQPQLPGQPAAPQQQNFANPGSALTQRLQQGRPGTPPAPGRAPTPMVTPGSMPGQSTPFNPAQMVQQGMKLPPIPRPGQAAAPGQTWRAGGHGEGTTIPQRQPANLANLGQSIQATVASRIGASQQGLRPGVSPAAPGSPAGNSLDDLGDRIRAAVAGNNGNVQPAAPGAGGTNLGAATTSIMDRVRQQLSQAGMPAGGLQNPNGTTPFPTPGGMTPAGMPAPGGPSTGTMPGGAPVPPGGNMAAPMAAPSTTTAPAGGIGAPTGTINCTHGFGCGGDWSSVNQYDAAFVEYGNKYGVDPAMLKAMAVIESGGQMIEGPAGAYGVMQIKKGIWGTQAAQLGFDLDTPEGQIGMAAAMLGGAVQGVSGSTPQERFLNSYYPTPCYTCPPGDQDNGITQEVYWNNMQGLINDINGAGGGTTTAPADPTTGAPTGQLPPGANTPIANGGPVAGEPGAMDPPAGPATPLNPAPGGDTSLIPGMDTPINTTGRTGSTDVVSPPNAPTGNLVDTTFDPNYEMNSKYDGPYNQEPRAVWSVENMSYLEAMSPGLAQAAYDNGYGFKSEYPSTPEDPGNYYCDYAGWNCNLHSGLDIPAPAYTQMNALTSGKVICVGGESSATSNPGVGCGAYGDSINGGIGNISVLEPNGAVVVYGHMNSSNYGLDKEVAAGVPIGGSGGMASNHVHLDVKLPIGPNGEYMLVDPNMYFNNGYCDRGYCAY